MNSETVILNLVGHSMGGIIARASLVHLKKYENQLGFYFSMSSPHLGYINGVGNMVSIGMWAIRNMKESVSMEQLSLK